MPTAHFPSTARPQGSCQHRGRCPHPRSPRGRGAGKTSCTLTTERCRLQPVKAARYAVASQALTGFQLRPLRLVLLPPRRWRGVKGDEVVHFTLDALNRPNTHRRGRWIGFATCPCGLASESGVWGKAPRACFLFLKLLGGCNRSKKVKKCAFLESLLLKTPQIWPLSDPTPTLTGVSNQKTSVFAE